MTRFLFATIPFTGHVHPALPIARELVARGHDVRWYTSKQHRAAIERTGARFVPMQHAFEVDDATVDVVFPERSRLSGIAQLQFDLEHIFIDIAPGMLRDLEQELEREPADVVVGDSACLAPALLKERTGMPWAVFGMSVLTLASRDTAPFGLAMFPSSTFFGRLRNRLLARLVDRFVFADVNAHFHAMRHRLGFADEQGSLFDTPRKADLYLQSGVEEFEYPRTDLPPQVHFIGSFIPDALGAWERPEWWSELDGSRPVVLVTQGTIANDFRDVIHPTIHALASDEVLVVVTTGSKPADEIGLETLPLNCRVAQFIPYAELMPKVDLLVTNGGYGSIQIALAHGVPVVACGKTEEKPEIANRVTWSGVGIGIRKKRVGYEEIRAAVRRVLSESGYRSRAKQLAAKLALLDARQTAGALLERLALISHKEAA